MCYTGSMIYDTAYRRRAIEYWDAGHSKKETAEVFKVDPSTLHRWKSRLKETGTLAPTKRKETWRKIDPEKLKGYLQQYPDAYLKEIAEEFDCTEVAALKALRRLKISRKKTTTFRETKFSEKTCSDFAGNSCIRGRMRH